MNTTNTWNNNTNREICLETAAITYNDASVTSHEVPDPSPCRVLNICHNKKNKIKKIPTSDIRVE